MRHIKDNIADIRHRVGEAAIRSGRKPEDITIVAVTKNFGVDDINAALQCGMDIIAENRVQEMLEKYNYVQPEQWHMIGHLQTNKVKDVVGKVDLIQSVDSERLLREINRQSRNMGLISNILL